VISHVTATETVDGVLFSSRAVTVWSVFYISSLLLTVHNYVTLSIIIFLILSIVAMASSCFSLLVDVDGHSERSALVVFV
jgi:hypothetical protein